MIIKTYDKFGLLFIQRKSQKITNIFNIFIVDVILVGKVPILKNSCSYFLLVKSLQHQNKIKRFSDVQLSPFA